ncbi:MAG: hypothetical protein AAF337_03875 [Pseudomonadota bacterium]
MADTTTTPDTTHKDAAMALLGVTSQLTDLLGNESDLLAKGASHEVAALAGQKAALFDTYQKAMQTIKALANPRLVLEEGLRTSLRETAQHFKAALERNQKLLADRLETSQQLMKTIGDEVQRQQNPVTTYSSPHRAVGAQAPTTLALNQTI